MDNIKMSAHLRFVLGSIGVVFFGTYCKQPAIESWFKTHPFYDALILSGGVLFNLWNTYANPTKPEV